MYIFYFGVERFRHLDSNLLDGREELVKVYVGSWVAGC